MMNEARYTQYIDAGLTEDEIELLNTPLANLDELGKRVALQAQDKYVAYNQASKEKDRAAYNALSFEDRIKSTAILTEGILRG